MSNNIWQKHHRTNPLSVAVLVVFAWLTVQMLTGCATTQGTVTQVTNSVGQVTTTTIPHFAQVEPGIYRSGQPVTAQDWQFVKSLKITDIVKLNEGNEYSDQGAIDAGLKLHYFPIDVWQQLTAGPDPAQMAAALALVRPGTLVHCEHGQDRTSLLVGLYRLKEGWSKDAAWAEMKTNGFHSALTGLKEYWDRQ